MNRKQRRELGLLPRQVLADVRKLAKEGAIDKSMDAQQIALIVAMERASDDCCDDAWQQVFEGTYEVDWDEVLRVLEMIIQLLIKYLPLFI
jgi:hypothetical protein